MNNKITFLVSIFLLNVLSLTNISIAHGEVTLDPSQFEGKEVTLDPAQIEAKEPLLSHKRPQHGGYSGGNFFYSQAIGSLFFVMERINSYNRSTWHKGYSAKIDSFLGSRLGRRRYPPAPVEAKYDSKTLAIFEDSYDAIDRFRSVLYESKSAEVWVAYVLDKKPQGGFSESDLSNVVMAVSVATSQGVPFQVHMGISRNPLFISSSGSSVSGLSVQLHAFAAKVMRTLHPEKKFLITNPLPQMTEILKKSLPQDAVKIGENSENSLIQITRDSPIWPNHIEFRLFDQVHTEKKLIYSFSGNPDSHSWFFRIVLPAESAPYVTVDLSALESKFGK
jgi:hypothetical protein